MTKLHLGCGTNIRPDWVNVDIQALPGVNIIGDICDPCTFRSIPASSVEEFDLSHILEHISNPLPLLEELYRMALPSAILHIAVPHGACDMAFSDPQHVRQYFPASFQFFAQPCYKRADYGYRGDWETEEIILRIDPEIPSHTPKEEIIYAMQTQRNIVWEMEARLRAVKPMRQASTPWDYAPKMKIAKASA